MNETEIFTAPSESFRIHARTWLFGDKEERDLVLAKQGWTVTPMGREFVPAFTDAELLRVEVWAVTERIELRTVEGEEVKWVPIELPYDNENDRYMYADFHRWFKRRLGEDTLAIHQMVLEKNPAWAKIG